MLVSSVHYCTILHTHITEDHWRSQYQETNSHPTPTTKKSTTQNCCPLIPANLPSDARITDADNTYRMSSKRWWQRQSLNQHVRSLPLFLNTQAKEMFYLTGYVSNLLIPSTVICSLILIKPLHSQADHNTYWNNWKQKFINFHAIYLIAALMCWTV